MPLTFDQLNQTGTLGKNNLVGILHIGKGEKDNETKQSLKEFRVTSNDPDMLTLFAEATGCSASTPMPWNNNKLEMGWETFTDCKEIIVIFESVEQVQAKHWVWSHKKRVRTCDGDTYISKINAPWRCNTATADQPWEERQKAGHKCSPRAYLRFRLAEAPDVGIWELQSSSFITVSDTVKVQEALKASGQPVKVKITLVQRVNRFGMLFVNPTMEVIT